MKTLLILAVILGVIFLYFVVKAEKSWIIKGNEVVPLGINIPKLILDKAKEIKSPISNKSIQALNNGVFANSGQGFINNIVTDAKNLISKTIDAVSRSIKNPIENKINEILCPKQ